ncbi:hypothetical protein M0R45_015911 [Rubus argutus]|uniref:Pierisin-like domain-containing protein n=1 Tax=Rubus argutus TaxID=59490 RepID=A0AAW1XSY0_RUBAR
MSSIPPDSPWRGCAANFPQPVDANAEREAQNLVQTVDYINCRLVNPPLQQIEYRSSRREGDILNHVFRWDLTPYEVVFRDGFQARRQLDTPELDYYNLERFVHNGGRPLDSRRYTTHAFVSTTLNSRWVPPPPQDNSTVYRYEMYAPGGIWVAQTLGSLYQFRAQDEVTFVAGIAPQYIRSAQAFRRDTSGGTTRLERVNNELFYNENFNPQSHPQRWLSIRKPVVEHQNRNGTTEKLIIKRYQPSRAEQLKVESYMARSEWYAGQAADIESSNIDAAFRSSRTNEVYIFFKNEYVLLNYAPGSTNDRVVNGPLLICDGYPSLAGTAFAEYGIDCAFGSHNNNEAFIFSGQLCAQINFAPGTTNDWIIKGPLTIREMFPFLVGTVFESGVDAAFEARARNEAYLFKDNQYALINYNSGNLISHANKLITDGFHSLRNTIFADGFDAAFASHRTNEAYLFKGESYALINFAPGSTNDYIIGGVKPILPNWPSLRSIFPRKNSGLDIHNHTLPQLPRPHDEL